MLQKHFIQFPPRQKLPTILLSLLSFARLLLSFVSFLIPVSSHVLQVLVDKKVKGSPFVASSAFECESEQSNKRWHQILAKKKKKSKVARKKRCRSNRLIDMRGRHLTRFIWIPILLRAFVRNYFAIDEFLLLTMEFNWDNSSAECKVSNQSWFNFYSFNRLQCCGSAE